MERLALETRENRKHRNEEVWGREDVPGCSEDQKEDLNGMSKEP